MTNDDRGHSTNLRLIVLIHSTFFRERHFAVPYNGEDNNDYVDGKGFCCNDGSLEAAQARVMARAMKNNFQEGDSYEKKQFYYHPDHLGSSKVKILF